MGYLIRKSNYEKIITLFDMTRKMSMTDRVVIGMKTLNIDSECSLKKEFTELICMNP